MKKIVLLAAIGLAAVAATAGAAPAAAAPGGGGGAGSSPVKICADLQANDPEAYEFLATQPGGCVSSVASVGVEALRAGAFPSRAAAVGNCKFLESTFSLEGKPEGVRPYPYSFYGQFLANNRADCVRILEGLHTGQLTPPPPPGA